MKAFKFLKLSILISLFLSGLTSQAVIRLIPRTDSGDPQDGVLEQAKTKSWNSWANDRDAVIRGEISNSGDQITSLYSCPSVKSCKTKSCSQELTNPNAWRCELIFKGRPEDICEIYKSSAAASPIAKFVANQIFGGFLIGFVPYSTTLVGQIATKSSTVKSAKDTYENIKSAACPTMINTESFDVISNNKTVKLMREDSAGSVKSFLSVFSPNPTNYDSTPQPYEVSQYPQTINFEPMNPLSGLESRFVTEHLSENECSYYLDLVELYNLEGDAKARYRHDFLKLLGVLKADCGLGSDPQELPMKTQLWRLEGKKFSIFTDGKSVTFGDSALKKSEEFGSSVEVHFLTQDDLIKTMRSPRSNDGLYKKVKDRINFINENGELILVLSGYANHDSETYSKEKLQKLNSAAWGGGIGKEFTDQNGNIQRLMFTCFLDSHKDLECSASYDYQGEIYHNRHFSVNAGFTAGLTSRADLYNRIPVPFVFPTASIKVGRARYNVVLVPKMGAVNSGAVLYFYATVPLKK